MSAGLVVWAAAFCALYGLHGVGCSASWPSFSMAGTSLHRAALLGVWLVFVVVGLIAAYVLRPARRDRVSMVNRTAWRVAWIGVAATTLTGLPIFLLPACL